MTNDSLDYSQFIDQAMRGAVRDVLKRVSVSGLPGEHHFYVSFSTTHPGTRLSEQLRAKYPREMTIVIQHQFWDFKVEEQQFHVTLSFGGMPEKLVIPYAALTAFADPSVKFGLQFQMLDADADDAEMEIPGLTSPVLDSEPQAVSSGASGAEVISIDAFRKK